MYQLRPLSGTRYSGTCHCKNFWLIWDIFWFDKQIYILYSDYTIKNKNIGEVAVAAQSADKRRLTRGAGVSVASKSGSHNLQFKKKWRGGWAAESGRLLTCYRTLFSYRGFESLLLRVQNKNTQLGIFILYVKGIRTSGERDNKRSVLATTIERATISARKRALSDRSGQVSFSIEKRAR